MKKIILLSIILVSHFILGQASWNLISTFNESINCIIFKDTLNGFAAGSSSTTKIFKTTDGGNTWNDLLITNLNATISKIRLINNNFIGVGTGGTIIRSSDGGNTWTKSGTGYTDDLGSVCGTGDGKLFACSISTIYRSTDNGQTWSSYATSAFGLVDIGFVDNNTGYGVGYYETSIKTTDGGNTWLSISPIISGRSMFSIKFIDNNVGYSAGGNCIAKTTNGGTTWSVKYTTSGSQLNDITTWAGNYLWVVGTDQIIKTNNTGETWSQQSFSPYHYLSSAYCLDSLVCFALASEGYLYKTTNCGGGATSVKWINEKPNIFNLAQNYPNPFNPTTMIRYSLSFESKVMIKIYNIIGEEVKLLKDEISAAGSYEVKFNSANFPSGVYFYRLSAESIDGKQRYSSIKKMILLK